MKNWKVLPKSPSVARYVDCYWFLEKECADLSCDFPKLNPDPNAHLIIADDDTPYEYVDAQMTQGGKGSHWIFPHLKSFTMNHSEPFKIIGVKFRIGALYSLKIADPNLVLNCVQACAIKQQFNLNGLNHASLLNIAATQSEHMPDLLDSVLEASIKDSVDDRHSDLVKKVLIHLNAGVIANMGDKLHRSQRTVERSFKKVTGLSMKQVQSMNRFEALLTYLYPLQANQIDWVSVAHQFSFSDQPHLIRYLKSAIGATPVDYAQQRDLTIDVYGNFECDE